MELYLGHVNNVVLVPVPETANVHNTGPGAGPHPGPGDSQ